MSLTWHYRCVETLRYTGATGDGAPLNSATITYAVYAVVAGEATAVPGGSGTLTYAAASAGDYAAEIDAAVTGAMPPGGYYYADLVLSSGGFHDERRVRVDVVRRAEA